MGRDLLVGLHLCHAYYMPGWWINHFLVRCLKLGILVSKPNISQTFLKFHHCLFLILSVSDYNVYLVIFSYKLLRASQNNRISNFIKLNSRWALIFFSSWHLNVQDFRVSKRHWIHINTIFVNKNKSCAFFSVNMTVWL